MDLLSIEQLKIETTIGAYAWEKKIKQSLFLDLMLSVDTQQAAESDQLADALDYAALTASLEEMLSGSAFNLLEALAQHTANFILNNYPVQKIVLSVSKPQALKQAKNIKLTITREKSC